MDPETVAKRNLNDTDHSIIRQTTKTFLSVGGFHTVILENVRNYLKLTKIAYKQKSTFLASFDKVLEKSHRMDPPYCQDLVLGSCNL